MTLLRLITIDSSDVNPAEKLFLDEGTGQAGPAGPLTLKTEN